MSYIIKMIHEDKLNMHKYMIYTYIMTNMSHKGTSVD